MRANSQKRDRGQHECAIANNAPVVQHHPSMAMLSECEQVIATNKEELTIVNCIVGRPHAILGRPHVIVDRPHASFNWLQRIVNVS